MKETALLIVVFLLATATIAHASNEKSEEYCIIGAELFDMEFSEYTKENGCILVDSEGNERHFFGDEIDGEK